jgi:hypothetical protein
VKAKPFTIKPFSEWKDGAKICLFRMWVAGAVCFFGAWGRGGAETVGAAYSLDLITGLIFLLIISDIIIVRPVVRNMFKVKSVKPEKQSALKIIGAGFLRFMKTTTIVVTIVLSYYVLNVLIIAIFSLDSDSVPLPLEPILFGIMYGVYFTLYTFLGGRAGALIHRSSPKHLS